MPDAVNWGYEAYNQPATNSEASMVYFRYEYHHHYIVSVTTSSAP